MDEKSLTVLYIEDDKSIREICAARLRRNYNLIACSHADQALEAIHNNERIDVLVTDLQIPAGDTGAVDPREDEFLGFVVIAEFRRKFRRAPVFACSQARTPGIAARIGGFGNARFISKPFRLDHVEELIEETLSGFRNGKRPRAFIVHGHDDHTVRQVKTFIETELRFPAPIILRNVPTGNRTVIEKLEQSAEKVDLVFVVLTPDDTVISESGEKVARARQNVIFELGYFVGALGRQTARVIILTVQPIELPSDIAGIVCIDITNGLDAARTEICQEVREWLA